MQGSCSVAGVVPLEMPQIRCSDLSKRQRFSANGHRATWRSNWSLISDVQTFELRLREFCRILRSWEEKMTQSRVNG